MKRTAPTCYACKEVLPYAEVQTTTLLEGKYVEFCSRRCFYNTCVVCNGCDDALCLKVNREKYHKNITKVKTIDGKRRVFCQIECYHSC